MSMFNIDKMVFNSFYWIAFVTFLNTKNAVLAINAVRTCKSPIGTNNALGKLKTETKIKVHKNKKAAFKTEALPSAKIILFLFFKNPRIIKINNPFAIQINGNRIARYPVKEPSKVFLKILAVAGIKIAGRSFPCL